VAEGEELGSNLLRVIRGSRWYSGSLGPIVGLAGATRIYRRAKLLRAENYDMPAAQR